MSAHPEAGRLQDYFDDLLCREERAELEAHLAGCRECTAEVLGARELRRGLAELPRSILPERDLLPGINAAIDTAEARSPRSQEWVKPPRSQNRTKTPGADLRFGQRPIASLRHVLAAAALVLIAVTALVTALLVRQLDRPALARAGPPAPGGSATNAVVRQVLAAEPSYRVASAELEAALAARRARLDPATVRLVEANLRVVERALAEARAALRRDPNNASLAELLRHAQEQKLALLRRATRAGT